MLELSLQTSFTTFCFRGSRYGNSSAAALLVENINIISLLEFQDNSSISRAANGGIWQDCAVCHRSMKSR